MTLDRTKLARVLALLASDQAGERDAAVMAATRMLTAAGMRWESLAEGGSSEARTAMALALTEANEKAAFWRQKFDAEAKNSDRLRTSSQTWGKRAVALEREVQDLRARLDIAERDAAKLRAALGADGAVRAVCADMPAAEAMRQA